MSSYQQGYAWAQTMIEAGFGFEWIWTEAQGNGNDFALGAEDALAGITGPVAK